MRPEKKRRDNEGYRIEHKGQRTEDENGRRMEKREYENRKIKIWKTKGGGRQTKDGRKIEKE